MSTGCLHTKVPTWYEAAVARAVPEKHAGLFSGFVCMANGELGSPKWQSNMWDFMRTAVNSNLHDFFACMCAVLDVLHALHSAGIVHQDAKLNNFLVKEVARGEVAHGITFECRGKKYMVACCDVETIFLFLVSSYE